MNQYDFKTIKFSIENNIAEICINRPDVHNAINSTVKTELNSCFDLLTEKIQKNETIFGVIIYGAGNGSFASGADLKELKNFSPLQATQYSQEGHVLMRKIENFPRPVVAAIQGYAIGSGCELALACHIRIAGPKAEFAQTEVSLGMIPGFGGSCRLARIVGRAKATELLLTGDRIKGEEAINYRIITKYVDEGKELDSARSLLIRIGKNAPLAIQFCLQVLDQGLNSNIIGIQALESNLFGHCFATQDCKEGIIAFLEKRKPSFEGK
jgi:enoyl-CoA hydratase